ncbi:MAG: hypothetical protein Q4F79_12485 [Eubacteriales bacterium]|nr:hypothetical protein [Eubacteriales bacterium]
MNLSRRERRRLARQGKAPTVRTYTLNETQINAIKQEGTEEAARRVFIALCALPLLAARDLYGFGEKRLRRLEDKILDLYDSFQQGYITEDDCINTLKDECGYDLLAEAKKWGIL